MKAELVVYGAFRDWNEYRYYYDLVFTDEALIIVELGRMPRVAKKRPALPRRVEQQLLYVSKERYRQLYNDSSGLELLIKRGIGKAIPYTKIVGILLRDTEIPIPPILYKPPPPGEEPKTTERVLEISIYLEDSREPMIFYTSCKLKEMLKKNLKSLGLYIRRDILEV